MEYHGTKDVLHAMKPLGRKNIKNALIYTELTEYKDDEYVYKVAETVEEASQLIESGCEHFCGYNGESSEIANEPLKNS
jgi:hypothetical protein